MKPTVMYLVIFASIALKLENVGPKTKQSYFKAEVVALLLKVQNATIWLMVY